MDQPRVGVVGGGSWARTVHGPGLVSHQGTEVAAVGTRRPEPAYCDVEVHFGAVDAVAFAGPPQVQLRVALCAAASGKHLICEKPLAGTRREGEGGGAGRGAGRVHSSTVLTMRHAPGVREWLAGMPAEPAGPDTVASARWLSGSLLGGPYAPSPWRAERGGRTATNRTSGGSRSSTKAGAQSLVTPSMRVPVDPSEIEFTVVGGAGRHRLAGHSAHAPTCCAALLDELVAAVDGSGPSPALDAARDLHLRELVERVRLVAR
jgi:GFO/IDH/MocA oxidoreductase family protein